MKLSSVLKETEHWVSRWCGTSHDRDNLSPDKHISWQWRAWGLILKVLPSIDFCQRSADLKGRYTIGKCQRPVFSLGVSQHKHKITSLWKFELNWSSKLRENDKRKNTPVGWVFHRFVILCMCWDTPSENISLWQLPIVSSVFKGKVHYW